MPIVRTARVVIKCRLPDSAFPSRQLLRWHPDAYGVGVIGSSAGSAFRGLFLTRVFLDLAGACSLSITVFSKTSSLLTLFRK